MKIDFVKIKCKKAGCRKMTAEGVLCDVHRKEFAEVKGKLISPYVKKIAFLKRTLEALGDSIDNNIESYKTYILSMETMYLTFIAVSKVLRDENVDKVYSEIILRDIKKEIIHS